MNDAGLLILDNSAYAYLTSASAAARLEANARAADWIPCASEVNLLESTSAPSDRVRAELLAAIRAVVNGNWLLPWPFRLLKIVGTAIAEGRPMYRLGPTGKEWYLEDPGAAKRIRREVWEFQHGLEERYSRLHAEARQGLQRRLRAKGFGDEFGSASAFLEHAWGDLDTRRDFAAHTWKALRLPGEAPIEDIESSDVWRLYLDAEGVAIYERAVASAQPPKVGRLDLLQLVYLGLADRRMIATADKGLLRAAAAVLRGRHANARAVHVSELV